MFLKKIKMTMTRLLDFSSKCDYFHEKSGTA